MNSVFKLSSSRLALLAAFGLAAGFTPAAAADLGGDCCADLEERVAELEATAARKGNRKVSLTVSGFVNEAIEWWDDGQESNTYVGTNNLEQTRVRFTGEAKITEGWSAGFTLELGTWGHDSSRWNQASPKDPAASGAHDGSLQIRKSNWYIKSKDLGKVTVGLEGTATYHILDDADLANTRLFSDAEAGSVYQGAFLLKHGGANILGGTGANLRWSDAARGFNNGTPGQSGRRNIIRYDSPTIAGFTATAAWGEDDMWDIALTYAGTIHDFKVAARAGYGESADEAATVCGGPVANFDCTWFGAAGSVMHVPTGLYAFGGYGEQTIESLTGIGQDKTSTVWFIQGGIEQKWFPVGKTTIYGEYRKDDAGANVSAGGVAATDSANLTYISGGVVQNLENAAMDLYLLYRHADGDVTVTGAKTDIDNFDMVVGGALIKF